MNTLRRYSGGLGLIGLALVAGFAARWWLLGGVDLRGRLLAVAAAVVLVLYAWLDGDELGAAARRRDLRMGLGSVGIVALAAALATASYALVRQHETWFDLTTTGEATLAPGSAQVVATLARPTTLYGFFRHGSADQRVFVTLADRLAGAGTDLRVELVDPLRQPLVAERFGVEREHGVVAVQSGDRQELLGGRWDEATLVDAIARVSHDRDHEVCWSVGHGERAVDDDRDPDAASAAVIALEGRHYQVLEVSTQQGPVPASCEVLVVAGPTLDWTRREVAELVTWVRDGGRALVLVEPGTVPELAQGLGALGLVLPEGVVLDADPRRRLAEVDDPAFAVIRREAWLPHPVASSLAGAVALPVARAVIPRDDPPGMAVRALLHASAAAWVDLDPSTDAVPDPGELVGEIPLVAVAEVTEPGAVPVPAWDGDPQTPSSAGGGAVFVVGDADWVSNRFIDFGANRDLFTGAVAWLAGERDTLAARAGRDDEVLEISAAEHLLLALLAVVGMPALCVVFALRTRMAKRRGPVTGS